MAYGRLYISATGSPVNGEGSPGGSGSSSSIVSLLSSSPTSSGEAGASGTVLALQPISKTVNIKREKSKESRNHLFLFSSLSPPLIFKFSFIRYTR